MKLSYASRVLGFISKGSGSLTEGNGEPERLPLDPFKRRILLQMKLESRLLQDHFAIIRDYIGIIQVERSVCILMRYVGGIIHA